MVSIRPSEMTEGGAVPVDQNLRVKEARFVLFDYQGKAKTTTAAMLVLVSDDGVEYIQHYSAADPTRFIPSQDGKQLIAVGSASSISKSSNFHMLMSNLVSAGFPENKLGSDISALEGLYAYWIGVPEPSRPGLQRTAEQESRQKVVLCPSQIHNLPWEKKAAKPKPPVAQSAQLSMQSPAQPAQSPAQSDGYTSLAAQFVRGLVDELGSITRQDLAVRVFKDLSKDPNRDQIATLVFSPALPALLIANGMKLDGEVITAQE